MQSLSPPETPVDRPKKARHKSIASVVVAILALLLLLAVVRYAVTHYRRAGSMSVIEAQSMDMSVMKPPVGAVPVEVATVSRGDVRGGVSYTGSVLAFNESQIAPRVTGRVIAMPVYPGDHVRRGQLLARLDSDELRAKESGARYAREAAAQDRLAAGDEALTAQAAQAQARAETVRSQAMEQEAQAEIVHAQASVREARLMVEAQRRGVAQTRSEATATAQDREVARAALQEAQAGLSDAQSEVENARAMAQSAAARLPQVGADLDAAQADAQAATAKRSRSAELLKQGAISREEYEADEAAARNAQAKVSAAQSRIAEVRSDMAAADAKVRQSLAGVRGNAAKVRSATAALTRTNATIQAAEEKVAQAEAQFQAAKVGVLHAHSDTDAARARLAQSRAGVQTAQAISEGAGAGVGKALHQSSRAGAMAAQAQAQLSEAQIVRGYTEIRAPSDGVVTRRLVAPGSLVDPGTQILQIAQVNPIRFQASVAQSDLGTIQVGAPVTIRAAAGQNTLQTRISAVFPAADAQSRTSIVEAVAPNGDGLFKPGEYILMSLSTSVTRGALKVPTESLVMQSASETGSQVVALHETASVWEMERSHSDKPAIYTCTMHPQVRQEKPGDCPICHMKLTPLEAGGAYRARLVPVKTGASDGDFTEILGGLEEGTKVITRGYDDLKDGDAVVPTRFGADGPLELPAASDEGGQESSSETESRPGMKMGGRKMSAKESTAPPAPMEANPIRVRVDEKGFSPANFQLKKRVPATLVFTRTTDATCATAIVWPDFHLNKKLPLNVPVAIRVIPKKSGSTTFACGMNMFKGEVTVR